MAVGCAALVQLGCIGLGCSSAAASPCTPLGFGGSAVPNAASLAQGGVKPRQSDKFVAQTQDRRLNMFLSTNFIMMCLGGVFGFVLFCVLLLVSLS